MSEPKFKLGDELFGRDPNRYAKGCVSITGPVIGFVSVGSSWKYFIDAEIVYPYPKRHARVKIGIHEIDLGHRVGTPLSQLDGRNGGNAEWRRISESWGYP